MEIPHKDMELIREALVDKVASLKQATSSYKDPKMLRKLHDAERLVETFDDLIIRF